MRQYRIKITYGKYRGFEIHLEILCKFLFLAWWDIESIRSGTQGDMVDYAREWQKEFQITTDNIKDLTGEVIA